MTDYTKTLARQVSVSPIPGLLPSGGSVQQGLEAVPNFFTKVIQATAYGIKGDGGDYTTQFQAMLNALLTSSDNIVPRVAIELPPGVIGVGPVTVPNRAGCFKIFGQGYNTTRLLFIPPSVPPVQPPVWVQHSNGRDFVWSDLAFYTGGNVVNALYESRKTAAGGSAGVAFGKFHRVLFVGQRPSSVLANDPSHFTDPTFFDVIGGNGVNFACDSGQDANNEQFTFDTCAFIGHRRAAHIRHSNSLSHRFINCIFGDSDVQVSNLPDANSLAGATGVGGSFICATSSGGVIKTCFELQDGRHPIIISDFDNEDCGNPVLTPNGFNGEGVLQMSRCHFSADGGLSATPQVQVNNGGNANVLLEDCHFNVFETIALGSSGRVEIRGGRSNFINWTYGGGKLLVNGHHNVAGAGNTLGGTQVGLAKFINCDGFIHNLIRRQTNVGASGATIAIDVRDPHAYGITCLVPPAAQNYSSVIGGEIGDELTIVSTNGNATIFHGTGGDNLIRLKGAVLATIPQGNSITIKRVDIFGTNEWIETGRSF